MQVPYIMVEAQSDLLETLEGGINLLDPAAANLVSFSLILVQISESKSYSHWITVKKIIEFRELLNVKVRQ